MPAPLRVPEADLPSIKALIALTDAQFDSVLAALGETPAALNQGAFVRQLAAKVQSISISELGDIARVVFILYRLRDRAQMSAQKLGEDVSASVGVPLELPDADKAKLKARLEKLLAVDKGVAVTAKAWDVMTEHQRTFCNARILSDIRPVFTGSGEEVGAAVIIHTLQVGYHEAGGTEHREFYVALDSNDVSALKEQILRAEKKDKTMQAILKTAGVPYLSM